MSRADAFAHLLRHLDDAVALRENPLTAHLFAGRGTRLLATDRDTLERLRRLVRDAAQKLCERSGNGMDREHAARQHAIVLRCDLGSELHAGVARDLGLSLSQFYRERRQARAWIAGQLGESLHEEVRDRAIPVVDPYDFRIEHAQRLHDAGNYDGAIDILRSTVEHVQEPARRLEIYCSLTDFLINARRLEPAQIALQAGRECYAALTPSAIVNGSELHGRLESVAAKYYYENGSIPEMLDAHEKAIAAFRRARFAGQHIDELLAVALIEMSISNVNIKRFASARTSLDECRAVLNEMPAPPPSLQARFLNALGYWQCYSFEAIDDAAPTLHAALEIAQRHRLSREAVDALAGLSIMAHCRGNPGLAMSYFRDCVELGKSCLTPYLQTYLGLRLLELDAGSARPQVAIARAPGVCDQFPEDSLPRNTARLFLAKALLATGDFNSACEMSRDVIGVAESKNALYTYGAALRVYALSSSGLRQDRVATEAIERAIEVLESNGAPYPLLEAYEASSRITGSRRHALAAAELRNAIVHPLELPGGDET